MRGPQVSTTACSLLPDPTVLPALDMVELKKSGCADSVATVVASSAVARHQGIIIPELGAGWRGLGSAIDAMLVGRIGQ